MREGGREEKKKRSGGYGGGECQRCIQKVVKNYELE